MRITIYHNPRCMKSRQTLQLLQEQGIEPEITEYLKTPLTLTELEAIQHKLSQPATAMVRTKEPEYKQTGLHKGCSDEAILSAIAKHPKLLERPIVVNGEKAAIGRPPEDVLKIL